MSYYAEMQKQTTIGQLAVGLLIASGVAFIVGLTSLIDGDDHEFGDIAWTTLFTALAIVGIIAGSRMSQGSFARAEQVRSHGSDRRMA
jgi:hypothetical protein